MFKRAQHLSFCLLMLCHTAQAACELSGKVEADGVPIEGAQLTLNNNTRVIASVSTKNDGSFNITYPQPAPTAPTVHIQLSAQGYNDDLRTIARRTDDICPQETNLNFSLALNTSVSPEGAASGLTIYIAPYKLYGSQDLQLAARFNTELPEFIFHKIMSFKTSLGIHSDSGFGDVSIEKLTQPLSPAQGSKIRSLGHQMGALAMVAGEMEVLPDAPNTMEVSSSIKPIPIYGDLELNMLVIEEMLPTAAVRPSKIGKKLHDYWGKQAIIAYVMQRLAIHQGSWSATDLNELNQVLIAVKSTLRDESDPFKNIIDKLQTVIEGKTP
jgi:hypothetical protein